MMFKRTKLSLEEEFQKWIAKNGACKINWADDNIHLYNGGLFQDMNKKHAELWIGDLNETIRYLNRLKRFLNKNGVNTGRDYSDYILKKRKRQNGRTNKRRHN